MTYLLGKERQRVSLVNEAQVRARVHGHAAIQQGPAHA